MNDRTARNRHIDYSTILPAALRSYIPEQLHKHVVIKFGGCDRSDLSLVHGVLDNSNDTLRMYGSAESLLKNLQIYMNFPLRRKIFRFGIGNYYHTIPDPYTSLKGELLYCKQDYLFHLQSLRDHDQSFKYAELIEYMKKHEERLGGSYEFVKYDHETFEDIRKFFFDAASLQVLPPDAEMTVTVEPPQRVCCEKKDFVKVFDDLISKYPILFLPNSETKDTKATAVVRVFMDSSLKFVMESELFAAINLKNPDRKPLECMDTDGQYRVIEYKRVLELFREEISDIDFMFHLITISEHRAVPIVAPTGDHCIQAADAFQDVITEIFQVLGVFQKLTRNTYHMVAKFVAILEKYFPSNIKFRYFINLKVFQKLQKELEEFWKPIEDRPVKKVRNVGPNGFTVEDLKKELKYLGYTETFSDITAEARKIYRNILKQAINLDTRDMFVAIDGCLMSVMFKRFPYFEEFMFRQKVCIHNRFKPCKSCLIAIKNAEARIEAEKKAEQDFMSSAVFQLCSYAKYASYDTTNEDKEEKNSADPEDHKNSEESKHEPVTIMARNVTEPKVTEVINEKPAEYLEPNLAQRCLELEKIIEEKDEKINVLLEKEKSLNREKEDFEATVNKMLRQLVDKDKEINKLKKANLKSEKSMAEELRKHSNSLSESEKRVSQGLAQLKNKDSRIQELEVKNSKINVEKNVEIEKLKKQHVLTAEETKKEIEQLKRNASDEVKKLAAKIADQETTVNQLELSNKEIVEKLRKSDSNLQQITKKNSHLEAEISDKNRIIQKLETRISIIRPALDRSSSPEPREKPECLICFYEMRPDQKTLKCEHCRKIVHFECASKWLKIHRSCAHCRREQLDPNEFPSLQ